MKRVIASKSYSDIAIDHLSELEAKAASLGYDLDVEYDGNILKVYFNTSDSLMPEITCTIDIGEDKYHRRTYYFEPSLKFPSIPYDEMDYHDTAHYLVNKWLKVTDLIDYMICNPYTPENYN